MIGKGRRVQNLIYIHRQCAYDMFSDSDDAFGEHIVLLAHLHDKQALNHSVNVTENHIGVRTAVVRRPSAQLVVNFLNQRPLCSLEIQNQIFQLALKSRKPTASIKRYGSGKGAAVRFAEILCWPTRRFCW